VLDVSQHQQKLDTYQHVVIGRFTVVGRIEQDYEQVTELKFDVCVNKRRISGVGISVGNFDRQSGGDETRKRDLMSLLI
jgi:hypothetical protein